MDRLDQIQARHDATTQGQWVSVVNRFSQTIMVDCWPVDDYTSTQITGPGNVNMTIADGEFIAHAHQDIPWLVTEVRELRHRLANVLDQLALEIAAPDPSIHIDVAAIRARLLPSTLVDGDIPRDVPLGRQLCSDLSALLAFAERSQR